MHGVETDSTALLGSVCTEEEAEDPCLPLGYKRAAPAGAVVGSGNFEQCRAIAKGLIAGQCQDELCPIGDSMPVELQGTTITRHSQV